MTTLPTNGRSPESRFQREKTNKKPHEFYKEKFMRLSGVTPTLLKQHPRQLENGNCLGEKECRG